MTSKHSWRKWISFFKTVPTGDASVPVFHLNRPSKFSNVFRRWVSDGGRSGRRMPTRHRSSKIVEGLELRVLPAAIVVNSLADNTTSGDGLTTLREAIIAANTNGTTDSGDSGSFGHDQIFFSAGVNGTILLSSGQMTISDTLTITGNGAANTLIDAQSNSRIFDIIAGAGDTKLEKLTLTHGKLTVDLNEGSGGAIRSWSTGTLTLMQSTISGSTTTGRNAYGGAIWTRDGAVTLSQSTLTGNSSVGSYGGGGAISSVFGNVTVSESMVSGNTATGGGGAIVTNSVVSVVKSEITGNSTTGGPGGAIAAVGQVTVNQSTLSGNFTTGANSPGGAIWSTTITIAQSTFSANYTLEQGSAGGAVYGFGLVTVIQSTLSGNSVDGNNAPFGGGAIYSGELKIRQSTVTGNRARNSFGGGINVNGRLTIQNSIVASNTTGFSQFADIKRSSSAHTVTHSLIGSVAGFNDGNNTGFDLHETGLTAIDDNGNYVGGELFGIIDPLLGPLQDNGGPTFTHAIFAGSPAIDHGSNTLAIDPTNSNARLINDQRGLGFARNIGGTVDMGAYEFGASTNHSPTNIVLLGNSVPENSAINTVVGGLSATDPDFGETFTFALTNNAGGRFGISGSNIVVANGGLLNFEANTSHQLSVRVTDSTGNTYDDVFVINVTDVNETPVLNNQTLPPLTENSSNETVVGFVAASNPDAGQMLTYGINGGNTGGAFAINLSTGQITVANSSALDFETNPIFSLMVQVTDNGTPNLSDSGLVTISLTDVPEGPFENAPPVIVINAGFTVNQGAVTLISNSVLLVTAAPAHCWQRRCA